MNILAGARKSPLSRAQFREIEAELKTIYGSEIELTPLWVETRGDRDKQTSLRTLGKTDFFTQDIDELLLTGKIRIGIHSAKDLPEPLREGLVIGAITKGLDPRDSLVMQDFNTSSPRIATSSERREETVRKIYPYAIFSDLRGTIQERLQLITEGVVDGIVVAEAALIRLGLTHLNRLFLPGETTPLQGKLAIVIRADDPEMKAILTPLRNLNFPPVTV